MLVATPLGNLGDLSTRAREVLDQADVVYCEDTRHSMTIFRSFGIEPRGRLRALHEHNEASLCDEVATRVSEGQFVALITDAGTPGISDPGSRVVAALAARDLPVSTVPGPSAVIGALSISGLDTERFVMEGFLPRKKGERTQRFEQWRHELRTIVFYESPQRLATTLEELAELFPTRRVAVVRELTKKFEEVRRGSLAEVAAAVATGEVLGEIVVVLEGGQAPATATAAEVTAALRDQLASGASTRDAVEWVSQHLGVAHRDVYRVALEIRESHE